VLSDSFVIFRVLTLASRAINVAEVAMMGQMGWSS